MQEPKIGFLVDSLDVENYVAEFFEQCDTQLNGQLIVICNQFEEENRLTLTRRLKEFGPKRALQKLTFTLLNRLERKLLARKHGPQCVSAFEPSSLRIDEDKILKITPLPSRANLIYKYDAHDIGKLKAENFDLIIRGEGRGILHGEILDVARQGIISFHYGDNRKYRGVPAGFWEVLFNDCKSELIIQKLDKTIDNGNVIARKTLETKETHLLNMHQLFSQSRVLIKDVLATLKKTGNLPKYESGMQTTGKLYTTPTLLQSLQYLPLLIRHAIGNSFIPKSIRNRIPSVSAELLGRNLNARR